MGIGIDLFQVFLICLGGDILLILLFFAITRFPIKDDVMMFCPKCQAYVWCARTVYPDEVYYTCKQKRHHFSHKPSDGDHIGGDKPVKPPVGYDEDDR